MAKKKRKAQPEPDDVKGALQDAAASFNFYHLKICEGFKAALQHAYGPGVLNVLSEQAIADLHEIYLPFFSFDEAHDGDEDLTEEMYLDLQKEHQATVERLYPTLLKLACWSFNDNFDINADPAPNSLDEGELKAIESKESLLDFVVSDLPDIDDAESVSILVAMFRLRVEF